jgi:hypothetical protein
MADAGDDHVRMRVLDLMKDRRKISRIRIEICCTGARTDLTATAQPELYQFRRRVYSRNTVGTDELADARRSASWQHTARP